MHEQLEDYLSQIKKQLAELPSEQREEELREIRSHLEMMIEENVARGVNPDNAVAKALEQFGAANKIGRDLKHVPSSGLRRKRTLWIMMLAFGSAPIVFPVLYILTFNFTSYFANAIAFCAILVATFIAGWTLEGFRDPTKKIVPKKTVLSYIKKYALLDVFIIWFVIYERINIFTPEVIAPAGAVFIGMWLRRWLMKRRIATSN